jgi:sugar lactone lactonase YvrE
MKILAALLGGALALATAPAIAQSYNFTILAGTLPPIGSRDGSATEARFNYPVGIAVDSSGNSYVADRDNAILRKITPGGDVSTLAGLAGVIGSVDGTGSAARFNQPIGVAVDSAGNIFVTDRVEHTIRKVTPTGVVTTFAGLAGNPGSTDGAASEARFREPYGIAIDGSGNLYIADSGNRTIRKITAAGTVSLLAGGVGLAGDTDGTGGNARFNGLAGVAVDGAGNLYVTDIASHVVRKITAAGVVTTLAGQARTPGNANGTGAAARFNSPFGVTVDASGAVFVADTVSETIRRIATDGAVTNFAGTAIAGNADGQGATARFFRPQAIAIDSAGSLYISDTFNHSIRKLTSAAVTSTLAGGGGNFGSTDGPARSARFNRPRGVGVDRSKNVYVAESFNNTMRKITPGGTVSTLAGQTGVIAYVDATGPAARFGFPYGVAMDANDNIFMIDLIYHALRRVTPEGVVSSRAGTPSLTGGSTDGALQTGRFNSPQGVVIDPDGNAYVADAGNHTIRRVTPAGVISTFAGTAGQLGSADGTGAAARFSAPSAVALDAAGNLFVTDFDNSTIRRITPAGVVTTFAGLAGTRGSLDGTGAAARFDSPDGVAIDAAGNLFVSDSNNHTIRKITPAGVVTTIGGQPGSNGVVEGTGSAARFFIPSNIAIDRDGALYFSSAFGNVIMKGEPAVAPTIIAQPQSHQVFPGSSVILSVGASGGGLRYQWKYNDVAITDATGSSLTLTNVTAGNAGRYTVDVISSLGVVTSNPATLSLADPTPNAGRIINLAIRSTAGTDARTLIVGVAIGGSGTSGPKPVLLRGVGPTLNQFGVPGLLLDPKLELFSDASKISENDDWGGTAQISDIATQVGAFPYNAISSKDAALYNPTFTPGSYSVWITGIAGATGVALAEIYDATPTTAVTTTTPRLTNVSARTQVGTDGEILIAGFVIGGQTSKNVLIRAVGPTLSGFGVTGVLANPKLELFTGTTKINENDDWAGSAAVAAASASVGAFGLAASSQDAALLVTLAPGNYTAQVSGVGRTTGVGLVEIYEVP